uniref:class I SAM-dependent RNA methyltransferase n=1 Tax=Anaerotignum sp. TaxID=2039241 RepID=UPI0028992A25
FGVEIVPEAILDARKNAEQNDIQNVSFEVGAAEVVIPKLFEEQGISADVIVVDPPRKGCDEILLNTIASMKPKKLIYVSCNPATLARDVSILTEKGFHVKGVQAVDQFPMTTHVEAIIIMTYCGDKTKKED